MVLLNLAAMRFASKLSSVSLPPARQASVLSTCEQFAGNKAIVTHRENRPVVVPSARDVAYLGFTVPFIAKPTGQVILILPIQNARTNVVPVQVLPA